MSSIMKTLYRLIVTCTLLGVFLTSASAQRQLGVRGTDSGGPLMPEQAAYDVKSYDLDLRVDPVAQSIKGVHITQALVVHPTNWFVLDLDTPLQVDSAGLVDPVTRKQQQLRFERREGKVWIAFPSTRQPGESVRVAVAYSGKPRVAPRPPWVGGFVWAKTPSGQPWVGVACQMDGADLWFPVKDHPSDEPETFSLHFTVPKELVAASNGRLQNVVNNRDGTRTFNWLVSNPINNYGVTLNIAPYKTIEDKYLSVSGQNVPNHLLGAAGGF